MELTCQCQSSIALTNFHVELLIAPVSIDFRKMNRELIEHLKTNFQSEYLCDSILKCLVKKYVQIFKVKSNPCLITIFFTIIISTISLEFLVDINVCGVYIEHTTAFFAVFIQIF